MIRKYLEYIRNNPKGYWFRAKWYGWGWTPATWQGWLIIVVYILAILLFAATLDDTSPLREVVFTFILPVAFLTALLIRICYKTGEKPRWQWGPPEKDKDDQTSL